MHNGNSPSTFVCIHGRINWKWDTASRCAMRESDKEIHMHRIAYGIVHRKWKKIKENTWMLWVKRNRKQMTIRCGYLALIAIRTFLMKMLRSIFSWTALTLKPHKSTCDISTCVGVFRLILVRYVPAFLFIYYCRVAFWTRPNLHTLAIRSHFLCADSMWPNNGTDVPMLMDVPHMGSHIAIRMIWSTKKLD